MKNKQLGIIIFAILLVLASFYFLKPSITGFIIVDKQYNYFDSIDLEFNENSEYIWIPEQNDLVKSLKLTGSYKKEGNVKVYLEDEDVRYLIFDSNQLKRSGFTSITGLVFLNETINNSNNNENNNSINNLINDTNQINKTQIIINQTTINETIKTNQSKIINLTLNITPIINETIINKTILLNLEYKKDSIYDVDDDGIEDIYSVVDLTVENTNFNWDVDENKLCTRWDIQSIEEEKSTTICNGNQNCCAFVDLTQTKPEWNDTLFLTYGLHGSTFNNKVSPQVIYVDYNLSLEKPYSEIYYSGWKELPVKFSDPFTNFENICVDTCILSLNKTSYKLIIEINNSILKLHGINYNVEKKEKK